MPRRARHLIPAQLPHRGEVIAALAVLVLLAHLLLAQLTLVLAALFAAVSRVSRWRLWWLTGPAAAGLAATLVIGPRSAAAGFAAGPARILAYLGGGHSLGHLLNPHGAFAGAGDWLPAQFPLALIAAAAEAALAGWLHWVHTDEWAVPPQRPGVLAAARGELASRALRAGAVVTRDGCALGIAPATGARVILCWPEMAGGMLVTGANPQAVAVSSLQVVHGALRRRKPLIAVDLSGAGALTGVLGAACAATGTPLLTLDPDQRAGEDGLLRVVRERSAVLFRVRAPDAAGAVCAGILALGEDLRRIGADGDGLIWLYGSDTPLAGPLTGLAASLAASGGPAGLPVLFSTTSPRAAADLAGLVSVVLVRRLADAAAAEILAARTGTRLVPPAPRASPPALADLVPRPAVAARTLLSLGPSQFVLTVSSPKYRLVEVAQVVSARLPQGALPRGAAA
jgi:hypothetical protein